MARAPKEKRPKIAEFVQTLIASDGPQVVLFKTAGTALIVAVAVDDDGYDDPFYGAMISRDQFQDYVTERFDLRYLFLKPAYKAWFLINLSDLDLGDNVLLHRRQLTPDIAPRFLPGAGIFAREHTQEISNFGGPTQDVETLNIDGSWDLSEFSHLYGQYSDLYFLYKSVDTFLDEQMTLDERRKVQNAFNKPWQGGGSYTSFFDSLERAQGRGSRLRVGAIKYASPGYVDIRGDAAAFEEVRVLVERYAESRDAIHGEYKRLYDFLSQFRLLTMPPERFDRGSRVGSEVTVRAEHFSQILGAVSFNSLIQMAAGDQLIAAKVLLATYRRLSKFHEFFVEGRVTFGRDSSEQKLSDSRV